MNYKSIGYGVLVGAVTIVITLLFVDTAKGGVYQTCQWPNTCVVRAH